MKMATRKINKFGNVPIKTWLIKPDVIVNANIVPSFKCKLLIRIYELINKTIVGKIFI